MQAGCISVETSWCGRWGSFATEYVAAVERTSKIACDRKFWLGFPTAALPPLEHGALTLLLPAPTYVPPLPSCLSVESSLAQDIEPGASGEEDKNPPQHSTIHFQTPPRLSASPLLNASGFLHNFSSADAPVEALCGKAILISPGRSVIVVLGAPDIIIPLSTSTSCTTSLP